METKGTAAVLKTDQIVSVNGQKVRVIAVDLSAPSVQQWGCLVSNPDQSVWFTVDQIDA